VRFSPLEPAGEWEAGSETDLGGVSARWSRQGSGRLGRRLTWGCPECEFTRLRIDVIASSRIAAKNKARNHDGAWP
jgi:hypothetical protein